MLKDDSFRSGTSTHHITYLRLWFTERNCRTFSSPLYSIQESTWWHMINQLQQLCWTKRNKFIFITYRLLISPHNKHLSKHRMAMIEDILFQFLSNVHCTVTGITLVSSWRFHQRHRVIWYEFNWKSIALCYPPRNVTYQVTLYSCLCFNQDWFWYVSTVLSSLRRYHACPLQAITRTTTNLLI